MAISSIHIQAGSGGYFAHNSRESKTVNSIFDDEQNYCSCSKEEAFKIFKEELKTRSQAYENRTGQKLQKNSTTHLSAIFNFNYETTPEQAHKVCEYLEKLLDTKVVQMSMHRDEGHIIEEESKAIHDKIKVNTAIKNYHGHLEFLGLDSQGNSIRRKLDKPMLRKIQTEVAKILEMQRGRETSYSKEEYLKITNELKPQSEYADKKEYNKAFNEKAKELGLLKERKAKRLDTYEYKKLAETVATKVKEKEKEILATKEQLKEANNQLRTFMKDNGAVRTDYAELEQTKKELEEKLKLKELTEKELLEKFQKLEETFKTTLEKKDKYLENLKEIGKEVSKEVAIKTISEIPDAVKTVLEQNKSLEEQKTVLADKVTDLEDKIVSSSNMSHPQPPKDVQEEFKKIKNEEFEEKEIKTGLFATEKAKVLKSETNFLQRTWNIVASKYEDLKAKYNDLVNKFKDLQKENETLKEKVKQLESEAPKQQSQAHNNALEGFVEKFEAQKQKKENIFLKKTELTGLEKLKEVPAIKEEESSSKKRGFGRSR